MNGITADARTPQRQPESTVDGLQQQPELVTKIELFSFSSLFVYLLWCIVTFGSRCGGHNINIIWCSVLCHFVRSSPFSFSVALTFGFN